VEVHAGPGYSRPFFRGSVCLRWLGFLRYQAHEIIIEAPRVPVEDRHAQLDLSIQSRHGAGTERALEGLPVDRDGTPVRDCRSRQP